MLSIRKILSGLVVASVLFGSAQTWAKTPVEFILDVSGSMVEREGSQTRLDAARKSLLAALSALPTDQPVALRAYGHRVEKADKAKSCVDTELLIPFGPVVVADVAAKITSLMPKGYTPIAYALETARGDFPPAAEARSIVLLTDGEETCGGDAVAVLTKLKGEGFDVTVNVIGFKIDPAFRGQLDAIAKVSGGQYYDAQDAVQLADALKKATAQAVVINKDKAIYGTEIRGGNSYETAVKLTPGTEFRLDHHQKINDKDYFYVDLQAGQELGFKLSTLEKGMQIDSGGKMVEGGAPTAGLELHGAQRDKLKSLLILNSPNKVETGSLFAVAAGRYYILIGNEYDVQNAQHVTFSVSVETKGDANTERDAGNDSATAIPLTPGRYERNFMGGGDNTDTFSFTATKGQQFFVGLIPDDGTTPFFSVEVLDEYKQKVFSQMASPNAGLKSAPFAIPENGTYILRIINNHDAPVFKYLLDLKPVGP